MSGRAQKAPKVAKPDAAEAKRPARRWKVHVNEAGSRDETQDGSAGPAQETHVPVSRLRLAALQQHPLPWRRELEAQFGVDLGGIRAVQGPEVEAALAGERAEAAARGDVVILPPDADKPLVAHEVAHVLQQRGPAGAGGATAAEAEARQAEARVADDRPVPPLSRGLPAETIAFRRVDDLEEADLVSGSDREAARTFEATAEQGAPETPAGRAAPPGAGTAETAPRPDGVAPTDAVDAAEHIPEEPVPTFEPAPMPEVEVDEVAAEAAAAEAEAALEGAEDADGLMSAFKDAPPSVKALHHDRLAGEVGEMATEDQARFEADLPDLEAEMTGTDTLAAPEPVQTPEGDGAALEDSVPPPPPAPEVDPTPEPGTADLNRSGASLVSNWFGGADPEGLGHAFNDVSTSDTEVDTSAGARPAVPTEGASDPQRVEDQDRAARDDARIRRQEATRAVLDGPGPERVEMQEVQESFSMEAREVPPVDQPEGPVEGAAGFRDRALDTEVVALFDAHHADSMADSLEEATAEVGTAVESRNTDRDARVAETEAEQARLNAEADAAQREEVGARRQEVQDARQTAVDAQADHVAEMETEADTRRAEAETEIDDQVTTTEAQVETDFAEAEAEAEEEVREGEREAAEERDKREREAENDSWWDRATDWVAEQFDKLTAFINEVFDAVRSAVADIIDAVKEAALALIDLAAQAIISAIETLGEALKDAVNALLAEHFPEVARVLNEAIDAAVEVATEAVNAVAERLKTAVSALLDALAAGLDAILAACQAAVNAALAIARAALTGDWGELAKLVLEPVLMAIGIQPAAFYEMIDKAMEALDIIIDDPLGFLSNLVDAFVGGVRKFGENLFTHLQQGIIAWLTGALGGGIQMPERFDLFGVLDLARQILGLTVDMIRRVAVRLLGEEAVERIEFVMGYVVELVTGGFQALWDRIAEDLSGLKDMVLEAIKSFLMERVIMAAITWLASLFNPVGALIKLVTTIWNFLMFLKDQLARMFQVLATIANTMWEIATGVLEPAMQGVENVLSRLLPIAIDLLARLLGLGNVAGKVQEIIQTVRQRIEDAIVNLINRVVSAFTGGRRGGRDGDGDAEGDGDGQIMTPIRLQGAGESHTLSIEDQGETVVPMIRSTPQPVQAWLDGRLGAPFEELAEERNWRGAVKTNKKAELESLVTRAKEEEAQLDRAAEETEDAISEGAPDAAAESQQTQQEGEQTKRALEEVLQFFGIDPNASLADHFSDDIDRYATPGLKDAIRGSVLNRIDDTPRYLAMDWAAARGAIPLETGLTEAWLKPAASGGILRRIFGDDAFRARIAEIAEDEIGSGTFGGGADTEAITRLLDNFVTERLNRAPHPQALLTALLGDWSTTVADVLSPGESAVKEGAKAYRDAQADSPDIEVFDTIKGSNVFIHMHAFAEGNSPNFTIRTPNEANGAAQGTADFLEVVTDSGKTDRYTKNREYVASAIRTAPGPVQRPHEWVQAASVDRVLQHAATALESGDRKSLKAASELIEFQAKVRTPTTKLIFKPGGDYGGDVVVTYKARPHRESAEYAGKTPAELPDNLRLQWYPSSAPQYGDRLGVLQAHSGGLYAFAQAGGFRNAPVPQSVGSGTWHDDLTEQVQGAAGELISTGNATPLKYAILGFYRSTIWEGSPEPVGASGRRFQSYYRSSNEGAPVSYDALKAEFTSEFRTVFGELATTINAVIGR